LSRAAAYAVVVALTLGALALAPVAAAAAPQPPPAAFSLDWVGDIAFSAREGLPPGGGAGVFSAVAGELKAADLATGNLEGTLGHGGPPKCRGDCFAFQAPSSYAQVLRNAGFGLLNLANNHSHDFGDVGLTQTLSALRGAHLAHTGLRGEITIRRIRGVKVAFLGFAPYPWASPLTDIPAASRLVRQASRRADAVVVFIHAGAEGAGATHTPHGTETAFGENRGNPRAFARAAVAAGADAVLGSGPHVLRGMECFHHALVAYSLGNFAGYRTLDTRGVLGLSGILGARFAEDGRFVEGRLWPLRLAQPGVPKLDRKGASIRLVRQLSRADFGARACRIDKTGAIREG
jgi:hypothetical protein